tara:strand:+ start:52 stop:936 length:885 start_codon:yes stop_codon:yes gene_type:complete
MNINLGDIFAIMTAFCWSSAVILFDVSSKRLDSFQMNVLKNFIGVFGFIVTIVILKIPFPEFSSSEISILLLSGVVGVAIADLFFLAALRKLGSGLVAVVSTIYSPSVFIIAYIMFRETITFQSYLGALLVVLGIIVSTYKTPQISNNRNLYLGILFGVIAQVLTAYSVLLVKPIMVDNPILIIALYRFSIGLFVTMGILVLRNGFSGLFLTLKIGLRKKTVILGAFLGTYLSVILWLAGFKYTLAGRAAIYNQLSTVFIVIMAALFLKESMSFKKWVGVTLSVLGAVLVFISN